MLLLTRVLSDLVTSSEGLSSLGLTSLAYATEITDSEPQVGRRRLARFARCHPQFNMLLGGFDVPSGCQDFLVYTPSQFVKVDVYDADIGPGQLLAN